MSWEIKDEWIDLGKSAHHVIYHNRDILEDYGNGPEPVQHHLIHDFRLQTCPTCGTPHTDHDGHAVDFGAKKEEVLGKLQDHHQKTMRHREQHPRVRIGSAPKK